MSHSFYLKYRRAEKVFRIAEENFRLAKGAVKDNNSQENRELLAFWKERIIQTSFRFRTMSIENTLRR